MEKLEEPAKSYDTRENIPGEKMSGRVHWALEMVGNHLTETEEMIKDVREIFTTVSQSCQIRNAWSSKLTFAFVPQTIQLRSIEQANLAIRADQNNRAILVFTVVTIIFLPLSFFTSYFGMNLKGVSDTTKTETYFWEVCGPVTVIIICLVVLFGFRSSVARKVLYRR